MPLIPLPLPAGSYVSRSLPQSNQQLVNWYSQPAEGGGLSDFMLIGTPGITEATNTGAVQQINRGAWVKNGIAYEVNGDQLYRVNEIITAGVSTYTTTSLGTIPGTGRVSMANNKTQLLILVPGGDGFIFNEDAGTPFEQITDVNFDANGNPQHVVFLDSFFVLTTDTNKIIISALNDGLTYDALDFAEAEADPDGIVVPIVYSNRLYILGQETIEAFQNIGGAGFPFQRVPGFVLPTGCDAAFSAIQAGGTFCFIGGGADESPSIFAFTGNGVTPISTDAIDDLLLTFTETEISQSFAVAYSQAGARFVIFTVKDKTFGYNFKTKTWHDRTSRRTFEGDVSDTRWRVNSLITAYGKVFVGDFQDGRIGILDLNVNEEYGQNIIGTFSTLPFANNSKPIFVPSIELTMEAGVGDAATPNPVVRMSRSKDGKTFSDEISRAVGKVGEFMRRTIWRRNGRAARFEVFTFEYSEKTKRIVIKLEANITG